MQAGLRPACTNNPGECYFRCVHIDIDLQTATVVVIGPEREANWAVKRFAPLAAETIVVDDPAAVPAGGSVLVDVTGGAAKWAEAVAALRVGRVTVCLDVPDNGGQIVLVGAGPGHHDQQSVAVRRELFNADVVFTDRLATYDDHVTIARLAPAARIVDVGKLPGAHRVPQREIEARMLQAAQAGDYVVRLKGGDPFVFGRGGEEVAAAVEAGIEVRVLPGITSAVAVPESVGIPVTHRGVARAFTVVSGHEPLTEEQSRGLVQAGGTIVVLMGVATMVRSMAALVAAGMDPDTPFAVVERGFTDEERVVRGVVGQVEAFVERESPAAPAVIVIGGVADVSLLQGGVGEVVS